MKLSFIVPIYNVAEYLRECIDSILRQTVNDYEIVLVNDGSNDKSGQICDEYAEKYSNITVIHQENQGVSIARNVGMLSCSGEWVFFVDGDDTISPLLYERANEFLTSDFDVCFVRHLEVKGKAGNKNYVSKGTSVLEQEDFKEFEVAIFNRDLKGKYDYHQLKMATPCKFYRKNLLLNNHIIFPEKVITGEDALFNLQVYGCASKGVYIDCPLYFHRVWNNSVSQRYDPNVLEKFEILHMELSKYIEKADNPQRFIDVYNERCLWSLGFACVLNYCSVLNSFSYKERKKEFKLARKKYDSVVKTVDLDHFRLLKRIMFWFIKKNWFGAINFMCYVRTKM